MIYKRGDYVPPKNKFSRQQMIDTSVNIVRKDGIGGLTARAIAKKLGVSTQPVFTYFSTMDDVRKEVKHSARFVYDKYVSEGLKEKIPFFGFGMAYISFAKNEPELYKLLFLNSDNSDVNETMAELRHSQDLIRESLMKIYRIDEKTADRYFRDMWLTIHSIATLCVTSACPYSEEEIGEILTGFSVSILRSIKEIPGFVNGKYNSYDIFKCLVTDGYYNNNN